LITADSSTINLSTIAASNSLGGFVINGEETNDWSGLSVSSAGDVNFYLAIDNKAPCRVVCISNSTQINSITVGFTKYNIRFTYIRFTIVVFGKADSSAINLSTIATGNSSGGFVINGEEANDWSGISVSSAGDVNGDGSDQ
jgi:hypothetical protein